MLSCGPWLDQLSNVFPCSGQDLVEPPAKKKLRGDKARVQKAMEQPHAGTMVVVKPAPAATGDKCVATYCNECTCVTLCSLLRWVLGLQALIKICRKI